MRVGEYITAKMSPFGFTEVALADYVSANPIDLEAEVTAENTDEVNRGMIPVIEYFLFAPRQTNISEGGFSVSYNFDNLFKWYLWLCRRYGIKPDGQIVEMSGLSVISDASDLW